MPELNSEFLFELRIPQIAGDIVNMGTTPLSQLMYGVAQSGSFEGPRMRGDVIPLSGGDWTRVRSNYSITIDVRICLKTHDGTNILMTYKGIMKPTPVTPENIAYMIDATKADDPVGAATRFYYRTLIEFETDAKSADYAWLNDIVAVASGRLGDDQAIYEVFAIK